MLAHYDEPPPEVLLRSDATCVTGRRLFEAMIKREMKTDASVQSEVVRI